MSQNDKNYPEINFKISSNKMSQNTIRNMRYLEGFITNSKVDIKGNVKNKNVVQLYKDRKISNLTTAEHMLIKLRTIQPSTRNKTMKQYGQLISKYEQNEPLK